MDKDDDYYPPPIVIDNGSHRVRAGFAHDQIPRVILPPVIARGAFPSTQRTTIVGFSAETQKEATHHVPIQGGKVVSVNDLETIYHHVYYNELRVHPDDHPLVVTEAPLQTSSSREKMTQMVHETFHCPMYLAKAPTLSLFAAGKKTGLVVDAGFEKTDCVAIYESHLLDYSAKACPYGGKHLTTRMLKLFQARNILISDENIVNNMKETLSYVPLNLSNERQTLEKNSIEYQLPDKSAITLIDEHFEPADALFTRSSGCDDIPKYFMQVISDLPPALQREMWPHVVLAGGNSLLPGFAERLTIELQKSYSSPLSLSIKAPKNRLHSAWIGGRIFAQLNHLTSVWISKTEYDEYGPAIVHRKCF